VDNQSHGQLTLTCPREFSSVGKDNA